MASCTRDLGPASTGESDSLFGQLSDDLLINVFRHVSLSHGAMDHALVCRRWSCLSVEGQAKVKAREGGLLDESTFAREISKLPNLTAIEIPRASLWSLTDRFFREVAASHPALESLEVMSFSTCEVNLMSSAGLAKFMTSCSSLRVLRLQTESHWEDFSHGFLLPNLATPTQLEVLECPVRGLPQDMSHFASLKGLSLVSENISRLPESFSTLNKLESLELDFPRLTSLPAALGPTTLPSLNSLSLICKRLSTLPPALLSIPALTRLHLECAAESACAEQQAKPKT